MKELTRVMDRQADEQFQDIGQLGFLIPIPTHDLFHYMFIKHLTVLTVRAEPDDAVSGYFVIQTKSYQNRNSRHNGFDVFISGTQGTQSNAITMPDRVIKNSTFFKRVISKCTYTGFWT